MRILSILLFPFLAFSCFNNESKGFEIRPEIKKEVKKEISLLTSQNEGLPILMYQNFLYVEAFANDTLQFSTMDQKEKSLFKSWYSWKGDTLTIEGAHGLFGGFGFYVKLINKEPKIYYMAASDDYPAYSLKPSESPKDRLEVPCLDSKLILNTIPTKSKKESIYGLVEFKSQSYYFHPNPFERRNKKPEKQRMNMKIYFKSAYLDMKNLGK